LQQAEQPILYYKRGCSTCDKARAWLAQHGIRYKEREIFRNPLSAAEVEDLLGSRPITDVLSTRSPAYKERGLHRGTYSDAALLRHMELEPRLLRRPILQLGDQVLIGFDPARWAAALGVSDK
jgi:regulatory protein spx